MKRFMKKMLSIALAGAMVLSLSVTALASEAAVNPKDGNNVTNDGGDTQTAAALNTGFKLTGTGENVGKGQNYEDLYKIVVPKVGDKAFNMLIDPFNLIALSKGSSYTGKTFATDASYMYFPNFKSDASDVEKYSATSDPLKIVNKSSVPVTVDLEVSLNRGSITPANLAIVKDMDALTKAESEGKAAIYMAVKDSAGNVEGVVEADDATPYFTITGNDTPGFVLDAKFEYKAAATSGITKLLNASGAVTWALAVADTETAGEVTITPTLTGDDLNARVSVEPVTVSLGNLNSPSASAKGTVQFKSTETGTPVVGEATFIFNPMAVYTPAVTDAAEADQLPASFVIPEGKAISTVAMAAKAGAQISEDIANTPAAYELKENDTSKLYEWTAVTGYETDDKFQAASYSLTGALSSGLTEKGAAAWEAAMTEANAQGATGISIEMVWKVKKCTVQGPSAKVTTNLTTATGTGVVAYSLGDGAKAATAISSIEYGLKTATTKTTLATSVYKVDTAAKTITFTNNSTIKLQTNTYVYINFDNGATVTVDLSKKG